jgi:hypothetical protein
MEAILMSNDHDYDQTCDLKDRLNTGWIICDQESDPAQRARLEDYWIGLLRQYEQAVDRQGETVTPWRISNPMEDVA